MPRRHKWARHLYSGKVRILNHAKSGLCRLFDGSVLQDWDLPRFFFDLFAAQLDGANATTELFASIESISTKMALPRQRLVDPDSRIEWRRRCRVL